MFELSKQPATVKVFSPRGEKTGDEEPMAYAEFEVQVPNHVLSAMGSQLRDSLYWKSGDAADQGSLDGVEPVTDRPNLRNPKLGGPLRLANEFAGYTAQISIGIGASKPIELDALELKKIRLWPKEGGTVIMVFRLQGHPDERACGKLSHWVGKTVELTLTPPSPDQLGIDGVA